MNTEQLEAAVRRNGHIADDDPDYPRDVVLSTAYEQLLTIFSEVVTSSRTERWVHAFDQSTQAERAEYRIHPRAIANGLRDLQIGDTAGTFWPIDPVPLERLWEYQNAPGRPYGFCPRGDHVMMVPTPNNGDHVLRQYFYVRPPRLVETSGGGRVTAVDEQNITVNSLALTVDGSVHTLAVGDDVDVVCPSGGFELQGIDLQVTGVAGSVLTVTGDVSRIQVGDVVRLSDTSDYPQLPMEMHTALAWATAATIMIEKGDDAAAAAAWGKVNDAISRAIKQLSPRVKGKSKIIVNRNSRTRRRGWRHYRS